MNTTETTSTPAADTLNVTKAVGPLDMLTEEQRYALNGRYNTSWQKPRQKEISKMQDATGFSIYDACFAVALIEDANSLIRGKAIARVADTILSNAKDVLKGNEDVKANAYRSIVAAYESLNDFDAPAAGKRFLDLLFKSKEILKKDAIIISDRILAHLEIEESEWR